FPAFSNVDMSPETSTCTDPWGADSGTPLELDVPPNSSNESGRSAFSLPLAPPSSSGSSVGAPRPRVAFQRGLLASAGAVCAGGMVRCEGESQSQYGSRNGMSPIRL